MPWALGKDETKKARLAAVMYNLCESLRIVSILLSPFMPQTTPRIQEQLGVSGEAVSYESAGKWGVLPEGVEIHKGETLFPRIDVNKEIEELNKLIPNPMEKKEQKEEPKAEKAEKAEKKDAPEGIAMIGIEDFAKVELRVAEVLACEPVKRAKKLLKLTLNDGEGERIVASGIAQWYKPEDLTGHHIVLVANLKPAKLCGVESQGMILAADTPDGVMVLFVDEIPAGSNIQ